MEFIPRETLRGLSDKELLAELRRCAKELGQNTITRDQYGKVGIGHPSTFDRRFGTWTKALAAAGLEPSRSKIGITEQELFEDLRDVWIKLGHQPSYGDMGMPMSKYSARTYEKRFDSWSNALNAFVSWVNTDPEIEPSDYANDEIISKNISERRTPRKVNDRQRFRILKRDSFRCRSCGASPATTPGKVELHVDHIVPWSKGGETVDDNLEAKCQKCNLGKGNALVG